MKKLGLIISVLFFLPVLAHAAIGVDATSSVCQANGQSTMTWSHTMGSSNNILIVAVNAGATTTGVTYAGTAMTKINDYFKSQNGHMSLWEQTSTATGANNIVASFSATAPATGLGVSYTGVNQGLNPDKSATTTQANTGATYNQTILPPNDSDWVVGEFNSNQAAAPNAGTNTTLRSHVAGGSTCYSLMLGDAGSAISPPATTTIQGTGTSGFWIGSIISLEPSGSSPPPAVRRREPIIILTANSTLPFA